VTDRIAAFEKYQMEEDSMNSNDHETLIRQYANGQVTWHELLERGFEDYVEVLGGLGELGLQSHPWRQSKVRIAPRVSEAARSFVRPCGRSGKPPRMPLRASNSISAPSVRASRADR